MNSVLYFGIFAVLLIICAVQSACRTAVEELTDSDLDGSDDREEHREPYRDLHGAQIPESAAARIRAFMDDPVQLTRSVWFWLIVSAAFGTAALIRALPLDGFVTALISGALVYLFGCGIPVISARLSPLRCATRLCGISSFLTAVSFPFTSALAFAAGLRARAVGVDPGSLENRVSEDEILSMVNEGHEQGSIDEDEAEMIANIFDLDDKQAQDIMTHRGDIIALDGDMPLDDAIRFMVDAPNSRFPVFEGDIDHIIGALYIKDAIRFHMKEQFGGQPVSEVPHLLREITFIPETVDVDDLFRELQESRRQMAVVIDEYGQTSGLVTMEDILEEIVGNILDEYDKEEKLIVPVGSGRFRMNGKALLEDVSRALGVTFSQEHYDTLSGFLTERLGHIPSRDDRGAVLEERDLGYSFRILGITGTMIGWTEAVKL